MRSDSHRNTLSQSFNRPVPSVPRLESLDPTRSSTGSCGSVHAERELWKGVASRFPRLVGRRVRNQTRRGLVPDRTGPGRAARAPVLVPAPADGSAPPAARPQPSWAGPPAARARGRKAGSRGPPSVRRRAVPRLPSVGPGGRREPSHSSPAPPHGCGPRFTPTPGVRARPPLRPPYRPQARGFSPLVRRRSPRPRSRPRCLPDQRGRGPPLPLPPPPRPLPACFARLPPLRMR